MSTNISKQKRDDLLNKIKQIKAYIESSPQDENTKNLLAYLGELTKEVNGKKYGLVFEEHREAIDEILEKNAPVLTEEEDLFIDNGGEMNFLIEGDNLAALKLLEKTHKGKIDVIYIDPPYNTGNKDFIYDDCYVDGEDVFKHSKWISFMKKRLFLARNLLSDTGTIFISIDDNEQAPLKIICDDIFGEKNFINQISIKSKVSSGASGGGEDKKLKKNIEYLFWYSKNKSVFEFNLPKEKTKLSTYIREHKETGVGFYYTRILKDYGSKELIGTVKAGNGDDIKIYKHKDFEFSSVSKLAKEENISEDEIYKKYLNKVFMVTNAQTSILTRVNEYVNKKNELISYEYIPTTGKNKGNIDTKYVWNETLIVWLRDSVLIENDELYKTEILGTLWDSISWGRLDLEGDVTFRSGKKPTSLIMKLLDLSTNKAGTVLDFFAGSGTTGHAVLKNNLLNSETRKFILCTNNQNNICRDMTYQRLKTVITGRKQDGSDYDEKYNASLKYYKIDYIPIEEKMYYEYADELLEHVRELVELENAIDFNTNQTVAIVLDDEELEDFVNNIDEHKECKILYKGHDVLSSYKQEQILKAHGISVNVVPDYYYRDLAD